MGRIIESAATAMLLIIVILVFSHLLNGTASEWIHSKFTAAPV